MMFTGETVDGRGPIVGACRGRVTVTLMSLTVTAHKQYLGVSPWAIAEEVRSSFYRKTTAIESFPDLSTSVAEILIHHQRKNLLLLIRLIFILFLWCFFGGFKVSSSWYDHEKENYVKVWLCNRDHQTQKVLFSSTRMKKGRYRR